MKRPLVLGTIVATGLLAITVFGQQAPPAAPGFPPISAPEKVGDNLYRIPGAGGNSAVFVLANGVLLVDTKLKDNGQALLDQIKKVTDKPLTHIINTHTHGDHTGSNSFFPASVEVVAQENTKANMEKMPAFQSETDKVGLPDRTYKDRMTLFSGKEAVDLYYFGPAHTNGDSFVVFRNARVMHAGDVFARKAQPFIDVSSGGSGLTYGDTIAKAAAGIKNVDKVITGHSDVMAWQDFVDFGEFNRLFLAHARASLAAGKSAEQALTELKLPEKFSSYDLAPGRGGPGGNFNVIYAELHK
jgi:glyoxylase-like metal-dependent hydrolase (beta-lactamase superfamily II)